MSSSGTAAGPAATPTPIATDNLTHEISISVWSLVAVSGVILSLRIWAKWLKSRGLWWDDHLLVISWILLLASAIVGAYNSTLGFGKHFFAVDPANLNAIDINGNIAATTSVLGAVWSKTSFALTLLRLMRGYMRYMIWFIIISMNAAMTATSILTWVRCTPPNNVEQCVDANVFVKYSEFSGGYSAAMDIILALMPWPIIWHLQMKKTEKLGVAIAMSLGIVAGATAIMKTLTLKTLADGDFTYQGAKLVIWGTAEVATTIMAASIPVLRVLIREASSSAREYYGYRNGGSKGGLRVATGNGTYRTVITANRDCGGATDGDQHELQGVSTNKLVGPAPHSVVITDDGSDRSILGTDAISGPLASNPSVPGKIVQTNEIRLEYSTRPPGEDDEVDRVNRMV